jgi:hypothetical protein
MAQDPQQTAFNQIYTLGVEAGIKRDGTKFESRECSDGVWCRFQRGTPKKMGGYQQIFSTFSGIPRGMVLNSYNGVNYIFSGNKNGLDVFVTGQTIGVGSGPYNAILQAGYSKFNISSSSANSFTISSSANLTSAFYTNGNVTFQQSTNPTLYNITGSAFNSTANTTTVSFYPTISTSPSSVWLANYYFQPDDRLLWQFDFQYSPEGGALNLITHPGLNLANIDNGIESQVYVGSITPNNLEQWVFTGLADTAGNSPTYRPITVDGGVCVLHPFIFVYGSNGFIANNHVSSVYANRNLSDWNGPLANQTNVAAGKIVVGMPVRGGTSSPSGLFWATDSLIRVSFVNNGTTYWQYDIISNRTSIMSSRSVVEMDGVYYWMGVDRFYMYNGYVTVLPNDKNVNWLFDNLNYAQRQKVWATKVPRYNEIWFFYPRGDATECTDAIIYNVKDKIWYDAGQAEGAQRASGYTTEIFPTPIWGGWDYDATYTIPYTIENTPAGQSAPTTYQFYINGDVSTTFAPSQYVSFSTDPEDNKYRINSSVFLFNSTIGGNGATRVETVELLPAGVSVNSTVYVVSGGYPIWQHERGLNKITTKVEKAIYSSFTTCDISWVGGTPSSDQSPAINRRLHLRRIEPDFVQGGSLDLTIQGRKFASSDYEYSGPFTFTSNTEKIDLRVEYREMNLKFESNDIDGNYEMGRILITAELGDERP